MRRSAPSPRNGSGVTARWISWVALDRSKVPRSIRRNQGRADRSLHSKARYVCELCAAGTESARHWGLQNYKKAGNLQRERPHKNDQIGAPQRRRPDWTDRKTTRAI